MNREQISQIHIKGFKSIKDCHLEMKMINVLIGTNGAGKSNFISLFKLLQDIIERNLQLQVAQAGGAGAFLYNGMKETEELSVRFEFGNNGYSFDLLPTDNAELVFKSEEFHYNYFDGMPFAKKVGDGVGYKESQWEKGSQTEYDRYILPILENQKWRVYHFHDTSKGAKVKQPTNSENNAELLFDASNLAAFLYRIKMEYKKNYDDIVRTIRLVVPYFEDFYLEENAGNAISLRWRQKGSYDVFNANQLSDGTLRFICLTTLLKQPPKLQPESIVIDEPELGLHPYAITILGEMIHSVSRKKQITISTQSVELLNEFAIEEIVVVNRGQEGTKFNRLDEEALSTWLETDYSLGDLWKKNVLGGRF